MAARAGVAKQQRRVSQVLLASASEAPTLSFMEELFGDDFPEAFTDDKGIAFKSRKTILDLPAELIAMIAEHMSKIDRKRTRLASKHMSMSIDPIFERVYISPNRANLLTLRNIMQHPRYSKQVEEIVWDEAQLDHYPTLETFEAAVRRDGNQAQGKLESLFEQVISSGASPEFADQTLELDDFFDGELLSETGKSILLQYDDAFARQVLVRDASPMTIEESYDIYKKLYDEEQKIMSQDMDAEAFQRALIELPNVRRVTLTSEVWRPWHSEPLYQTPFYRSLPPGFQKPPVYPWLGYDRRLTESQVKYRNKVLSEGKVDHLHTAWRGFRIVSNVLADANSPQIEELIFDTGNEPSGVSYQLFHAPNTDFDTFYRLAQHQPLTRLELSINTFTLPLLQPYPYLWNGAIESLLGELHHLRHLDFDPHCNVRHHHKAGSTPTKDLLELFPATVLRQLQTFALRNFWVSGPSLYKLIMHMPNIEHITLDNVMTFKNHPNYGWRSMVFDPLKKAYAHPKAPCRPRFTWKYPLGFKELSDQFKVHLIEEELDAFLYDDGECPFGDESSGLVGFPGWIVDDRDPTYKRKWSLELGQELLRPVMEIDIEG